MAGNGIVAIGECMLELSGKGGQDWRMGFAGDTLNTLWALRALTGAEHAANYISAFGDDPFSRDQIAFFRSKGIGIGESPVIPGARPGLYAITLTGAERSFTYWRSDSAAKQLASNPAALAKSLENQALVYFSGITLAILDAASRKVLLDAVAAARKAGSLIAFDANYRPRLWKTPEEARDAIEEALAVTDIALPTFPDEQMLCGDVSPEATAERLAAAGVRRDRGQERRKPCAAPTWRCRQKPYPHSMSPRPSTPPAREMPSTAATWRRGWPGTHPPKPVKRAHNVAAAVVQVRGALAPFETLRAAFQS